MQLIDMQRTLLIDMDQSYQHNYLALLKIKTSLVITHFYYQAIFLLVHHLNENITS